MLKQHFLLYIKHIDLTRLGTDSGAADFGSVLEGFWEGLGRSKTSIFAVFSCFFRCDFRSAFRKAEKSTKKANLEPFAHWDCGGPPPAGRDYREGSRSAKEVQTILGEDRISIVV